MDNKPQALAEMYGAWLKDIRVVHNSIDPRTFWNLNPFVDEMIDKYHLLDADIISVYPVSSTRMVDGKQIDVLVKIHGFLKQLGLKTRLIIPNAHCNAKKEQKEVEQMIELGVKYGLVRSEILFTSKEGHENGIPRDAVSDFFRLSNVFIMPSISENCSLILLEAMLSGNMLVLNKDCTGLQEFGGANAQYHKFGNIDMGIRNKEDALTSDNYLKDIARIIKSEYETNKALKAKANVLKNFNLDETFKQIENLYFE